MGERTPRGGHRKPAWAAVVLTGVALVGVFLPWWSMALLGDGGFFGPEMSSKLVHLGSERIAFAGYHEAGVDVVVYLVLGLGAMLASVMIEPWARRPTAPLFVAFFLVITATIVTALPMLSHYTLEGPRARMLEVEHGWWVTAIASALACGVILIALRRAALEAREGRVDPPSEAA